MKTWVIPICLLFHSVFSVDIDIEWGNWKQTYSKNYQTIHHEIKAKANWRNNFMIVHRHNNLANTTYYLGLNEFSDKVLSLRPAQIRVRQMSVTENSIRNTGAHLPDHFDWRDRGVVFPVRNQGEMGSPIAMAATDAVASFHAINGGKLLNLSTSEFARCCGGFRLDSIFRCVHKMGGLCQAQDYNTTKCNNPGCDQVAKVNGGASVKSGQEVSLQEAVLLNPVVAGVDASQPSFQLYQSGVYTDASCSSTRLDHDVLVVGYGMDSSGNEYWICKNSWGSSWGMKGYILIARNKGNMCGISTDAKYPI